MDGLSSRQGICVAGKVLSWWDPGHCRDFWKRRESLLLQYPMGWTKYLSPAQTLSVFFLCMMLEKTLESPLDCKERRRSQSILKEIHPECSLEGLILKLKLQYFDYLTWRANSLEKILMLGKIEGRRRRDWQRMRWLDGIINTMVMSLSRLWEMVKDGETWRAAVFRAAKSQTWCSNWTTTKTTTRI